ncbi:hypothetical protein [Alteromonas sp. KUL49]|uniref:hypothetical protein n=1 Tax=Alteromonas sp. KUL49 TaxID=2480798 RepID=UPI00102EE3BE|nr:hypothetical protein [Alteromonas sp. KUL49]TAP38731.1 hypothetical protein EYS00_15120 [Alteromonas sp. KUL49]
MSKDLKEYVCVDPVKHNGVRVLPDQPIWLSQKEAKSLLNCNAIAVPALGIETSEPELTELEKVLAVIPDVISNKDNLTGTGAPSTAALTEAVGFDVSAELRNEAWSAYQAAQGTE